MTSTATEPSANRVDRYKKRVEISSDKNDNDNDSNNTNSKRVYQNYSYYRYEEVEAKWLSPTETLPPDTLCWVLQSKGKRGHNSNKNGKSIDETVTASAAAAATTSNSTKDGGGEQQQYQRKQLLNWARVAGQEAVAEKDETTSSADNDTASNNSPDKKKHKKETPSSAGDRILVRYPKGSTYHVKRENLLPVLTKPECLVVALPETNTYHRWTVVHTHSTDAFCEIGCDVGILVQRVWTHSQRQAQVWGIDKGVGGITSAKERYPDLASQFRVWNVPLAAFANDDDNDDDDKSKDEKKVDSKDDANKDSDNNEPGNDPDYIKPPLPMDLFPNNDASNGKEDTAINSSLVVAIDINGNRELEAVRQCVELVIQEWKPRLIIVKSRALYADLQ